MSAGGSRHDMRVADVATPPASPDLSAALDAAVSRRLRALWQAPVLLLLGAAGGAGGMGLAQREPAPPPPEPRLVCECPAPEQTVVECRLAADYFRKAAAAAGVSDGALEHVAREVLGAPPAAQ